MKRVLSLLLIMALLISDFSMFTTVSYAVVSVSEYPGYNQLDTAYKARVWNGNDYVLKTVNLKSVVDQLKASGTPLFIGSGVDKKYLCAKVYAEYGLAVYDLPTRYMNSVGFGSTNAQQGATGKPKTEYRYLGYDLTGKIAVTNDLYYNDTKDNYDASKLLTKNWIVTDEHLKSWNLKTDKTKDTYLFTTPLKSDDGRGSTNINLVTLSDVLKKNAGTAYTEGMDKDALKNLKSYAQLLTAPGLGVQASTLIRHRTNSGAVYYNTLTWDGMKKTVKPIVTVEAFADANCTQPITKIDLLPSEESRTFYARVNTNVDMKGIGLLGKEATFIASVQNTFSANEESKDVKYGPLLTNFSAPSKMASVFPVTVKAKNYSSTYKDLPLKGHSVTLGKSDFVGIGEVGDVVVNLPIKKLDPTSLSAAFQIWHEGVDKTEGVVVHPSKNIDKAYTFDLKDQSYVTSDNEIKNWNWFVLNHSTGKYDYFAWTKDTSFTLALDKQAQYLKEGKVTFKEVIVDKVNRLSEVTHSIHIETVEVKELSVPKATLHVPAMIRAGAVTTLTGEGTSNNGSIISYDFELDSDFGFLKNLNLKQVEGSFLSYDSTSTTGLMVTDSSGKTATTSAKTEVTHPLEPVFKTKGVYKVNRTITLDSTESTGTKYYPIDKVTWTIKPMEGQSLQKIKPHGSPILGADRITVVGADPKVDPQDLKPNSKNMNPFTRCRGIFMP